MIEDALDVPDDTRIDCDLCIVGGGMAGLAIARTLRERDLRIVVLEGGGAAPEPDSQALYEGSATLHDGSGGTHDLGAFLHESRLRCLGGSGNIWGAKCAVLDESDFAKREWMPESGWPFPRADLAPFYDRACDLLSVPRFDYDPASEFDAGRPPLVVGEGARSTTATRHLSPVRGGPGTALDEYKREATESARVQVFLHASVLELETDERGTRVHSARAGTLRGNRFRVHARAFVLAAGGIENARLLLVSTAASPKGLGNGHDLVGRYFSNHTTFGPGAALGFTRPTGSLDLYTTRDPRRIWGVLALSRAAQERERAPNFTVTMAPAQEPPASDDTDVIRAAALADGGFESAGAAPADPVPVYFMIEQRQNPESRLTLAEERDALGVPRVRLDWRFTAQDEVEMRNAVRAFARELGEAGQGRVRCEWPAKTPVEEYSHSRHHIGTTRMHPDPRSGVVDADARVHGVANLWIAGSSVFPTPGIANPTLTVVALALRLADRLARELAS